MNDNILLFGGFLILILCWTLYLLKKNKNKYNSLIQEYNKTLRILNLKISELEKTKQELNIVKNQFNELKLDYKEELNKILRYESRLSNAVKCFKEQKENIEKLQSEKVRLDRENEELFVRSELLKKNNDFNTAYEFINQGKNIFITGGAGTGKSYILRNLAKAFPQLRNNITSTTGISAINIGGITIHSWSEIGRIDFKYNKPFTQENRENEIEKHAKRIAKKINRNKVKLNSILTCTMLAIDEISMFSDDMFSLTDKVLRLVKNNNRPFGGIQMVLIGDFCQLPPVIKNNYDSNNQHFVFNSKTWGDLDLQIINLETVHRQKDKEFATILNELRFGRGLDNAKQYLENCEVQSSKLDYMLHIYPSNHKVNSRNSKYLNKIQGKEFMFEAFDYLAEIEYLDTERVLENIRTALPEDINYLDHNGQIFDKLESDTKAKKNLKLKIGCRVMLIKNLNVDQGFANGSMGIIKEIAEDTIIVEIDNCGECSVKKEDFETDYKNEDNLVLVRKQFPLTLAYAITIHKSQGLTFEEAAIDISGDKINCGQGYVALSRVKTKDGLYILGELPIKNIFADKEVVAFYESRT